MLGSVVVVVIVGAVVCAIVAAMVGGRRGPRTGSQPATAWRPTALAPDGAADDPFVPVAHAGWTPRDLAPEAPSEPAEPTRRVRSVLLLATTIVILGSATAGLIGATALLIARVVDAALGP